MILDASASLSSPSREVSDPDPLLSLELHTPASFTLSHCCSVGPSHSSKKKRIDSPLASKSVLNSKVVCKSESVSVLDLDVVEISEPFCRTSSILSRCLSKS